MIKKKNWDETKQKKQKLVSNMRRVELNQIDTQTRTYNTYGHR